jgi:hypothetical protein
MASLNPHNLANMWAGIYTRKKSSRSRLVPIPPEVEISKEVEIVTHPQPSTLEQVASRIIGETAKTRSKSRGSVTKKTAIRNKYEFQNEKLFAVPGKATESSTNNRRTTKSRGPNDPAGSSPTQLLLKLYNNTRQVSSQDISHYILSMKTKGSGK